ncbi:MAG: Asp-tRNA(Asn)/Glu-tRNA(Gln) amidotransferase subunit GatC [Candidatus Pacebacteria bacterium]|nr:Asp-tRNA(Asn)/Glu-tRNA(Gln) amidotransferase subunit GatC [Candidatus Paceibacterota bacterium]
MIKKEEILHLAKLSHLKFSDEEIVKLEKDLDSILDYVDQVKEVTGEAEKSIGAVHNVMREDENPFSSGENSEEIINEFPEKEGDFLKVKKIL